MSDKDNLEERFLLKMDDKGFKKFTKRMVQDVHHTTVYLEDGRIRERVGEDGKRTYVSMPLNKTGLIVKPKTAITQKAYHAIIRKGTWRFMIPSKFYHNPKKPEIEYLEVADIIPNKKVMGKTASEVRLYTVENETPEDRIGLLKHISSVEYTSTFDSMELIAERLMFDQTALESLESYLFDR